MSKKTIAVFPRGIDIQLTKNFSSSEFDCKCQYANCSKTLIDLEMVVKLQKLRDLTGPLKVTSGFRCKKHNKDVGGSPTSQHTKGTAADIVSRRIHPDIIAETAEQLFDGVGRYDTFTHMDTRGSKARWDQRSG